MDYVKKCTWKNNKYKKEKSDEKSFLKIFHEFISSNSLLILFTIRIHNFCNKNNIYTFLEIMNNYFFNEIQLYQLCNWDN